MYFRDYILPFCELRIITGRIKFDPLDNSVNLDQNRGLNNPVILCIYDPTTDNAGKFCHFDASEINDRD